jgi:hypothetical protein
MSKIKPINDTLQIKIEDDGTITVVTGKIGAEVHQAADQFLADVEKLSGGERQDTRLAQQSQLLHHHHHDHERVKAR